MKKIVLLLIAVITINCLNLQEVKAATQGFYEAEYADYIYTRRTMNEKKLYQRARFFRQRDNDNPAYCIEPFAGFGNGLDYIETNVVNNLNEETLLKLTLLANYGYMYPGHEDIKWYAITQQLIWQTAEPNGTYEFTDRLNGNTIYPYEAEINELWNLVNQHLVRPSFSGQTIDVVENQEITLNDNNQVVSNYQTNDPNVVISGNTLKINGLTEGSHTINLVRKATTYATPALFYFKGDDQKVMTLGNAKDIYAQVTINVTKTGIEITKVDKDTNSTTPSGEGKLEGATYGLYDEKDQLITEFIIGKDNKASAENIPFGSYILKELTPGIGYQLDPNSYKVEINSANAIVKLQLANEIIKKKIEIHKEYGTLQNTKPEENVIFDIYDSKGHFIKSMKTNSSGYAEAILPYGTYTIHQRNSKENYKLIDDFEVKIQEENQDLTYQLYDYKIEVPNTKKEISYLWAILLLSLLGGKIVIQKQNL